MQGELIPMEVTLRSGDEYIGLMLDGQYKTGEWMRLERAVRVITVPTKDPNKMGRAMVPLTRGNQYLGYVDIHPDVLAVVAPLDTKGGLYRDYQAATSGLTLPRGVGTEEIGGIIPSAN